MDDLRTVELVQDTLIGIYHHSIHVSRYNPFLPHSLLSSIAQILRIDDGCQPLSGEWEASHAVYRQHVYVFFSHDVSPSMELTTPRGVKLILNLAEQVWKRQREAGPPS